LGWLINTLSLSNSYSFSSNLRSPNEKLPLENVWIEEINHLFSPTPDFFAHLGSHLGQVAPLVLELVHERMRVQVCIVQR